MVNYLRLFKTWQRLKTFQYRDVSEIKEYQMVRFKSLIQHAYESVPMYREFYDSHRFNPFSIHSYQDIEDVPIITKDIIRSFPLETRVDSHIRERDVFKESTSGSTGEPLEIWSDRTDSIVQSMKCIRFLREWGYSAFDQTVQLWRDVHGSKKMAIQKLGLFNRQYVSFLNDVDTQIKEITRSRCDVLFSSRSSLEILADGLKKRNYQIKPRILVSGSEMLTNEHRRLFEEVFGCSTLEIYGCNEIGNIAWECPQINDSNNLHVEMESVVVNFHNLATTPDNNKTGSIIVTNLENYTMPFIRYDLGDVILCPTNLVCNCGRTLPVLGKVLGRNDDVVHYNGRMFNWHFFYNYFKDYKYIKKYKIIQTKTDDIEFQIHLAYDTEENKKLCLSDLSTAFGKYFSPLNVRFVEGFPISATGKFKVIEKET